MSVWKIVKAWLVIVTIQFFARILYVVLALIGLGILMALY